jgi:hypothetical protein
LKGEHIKGNLNLLSGSHLSGNVVLFRRRPTVVADVKISADIQSISTSQAEG